MAGLRVAFSTLTVAPVRVGRVDRAAAGWAMALAPAVGAALGVVVAGVLGLALAVLSPVLAAALAVGVLALVTRGLHLDGLADLADGLGSARPADEALAVMRRSDIGAFGVATLVLVVLVQVLALGELASTSPWAGAAGALVAVAAGRLAITWACTPHVSSARPDGLGFMVAGGVPHWAAGIAAGGTLLLALAGLAHAAGYAAGLAVAAVVGLAAGVALLWHAVRRLGGITGDVLGAVSETATTTALVVAAAMA